MSGSIELKTFVSSSEQPSEESLGINNLTSNPKQFAAACKASNTVLENLSLCLEKGLDECASELIKTNPYVVHSRSDRKKISILHLAARFGRLKPVQDLMLTEGCDPNARDNCHLTPLHYAAEANQEKVVQFFLEEEGVDANAHECTHRTALHCAVNKLAFESIRCLLASNKVDREWKDVNGQIARDINSCNNPFKDQFRVFSIFRADEKRRCNEEPGNELSKRAKYLAHTIDYFLRLTPS